MILPSTLLLQSWSLVTNQSPAQSRSSTQPESVTTFLLSQMLVWQIWSLRVVWNTTPWSLCTMILEQHFLWGRCSWGEGWRGDTMKLSSLTKTVSLSVLLYIQKPNLSSCIALSLTISRDGSSGGVICVSITKGVERLFVPSDPVPLLYYSFLLSSLYLMFYFYF